MTHRMEVIEIYIKKIDIPEGGVAKIVTINGMND